MTTHSVSMEFIEQSIHYIELNTPRIEKCLADLTEEEVWNQPNESTNSIGNLILHLCGNITQYILSSIGGLSDNRERDKEFSTKGGLTKAELLQKLQHTINSAVSVIRNCDQDSLVEIRSVQGFNLSGIGIIVHVTEHYSYHTGQIALLTKMLRNKDLGFYADRDLNVHNR